MSDSSKPIEILSRVSTAAPKRTTVRLDLLKFDTEQFCHRDTSALQSESLASLMDSLILEGLQVPIEFYRDGTGSAILVKGHRRTKACRLLADKNEPGFTADMEIDAIEVTNATPADLLVRSISDNEVRLNLDRVSRIRVAKKLHDAGVSTDRAARAMGVSAKTYDRDLLIARHLWMFQHVIDDSIAPTHAFLLLAEAEKEKRLVEMRADLDAWIAAKKKMLREKEKVQKAKSGKELSPADKQVKKYLQNHMVTHWVELLKDKKRFDEDAKWKFAAGIETQTKLLRISAVTLDLTKAPLDRLAKVAGKLSLLTKQMTPYLKTAHEKESGDAATTDATTDAAYDLDYLRELGLEEVASELEAETQIVEGPDGEESPQDQPADRQEKDLTQEVELPPAGSTLVPISEPAPAPTPEPELTPVPMTATEPAVEPMPEPAAPSAPPAKNAPTGKRGAK